MENISILKILKPQGLKGELKCLPLTENTDIFSTLKTVNCEGKEINIISSVYRLGFVYIKIENVNSIEDAEKYRGKEIEITKEQYGALNDNTYFIDELIGLTVYDENDTEIGEVLGVENYGATDILEIKDKWRTYLVPFIEKVFVRIDIDNKKVVINRAMYEEHRT